MAATIADCPPCELPTQYARCDAERVEQGDRGPRLHGVHPLAVDDRARLRKIRQVHQDAAEVLRQRADRLVKRDPRGGAGTVGVEEQHRLALAHIVVVHSHAPACRHRDGLAGARLGEAIRRDERHVFRSAVLSRPRPTVAKRIDQQGEGWRGLAAARVVEVIARIRQGTNPRAPA